MSDLPELLLEVHAWTGFLHAYVHVSGRDTRMKDLPVSVAALLIAEACNVGLTPVIDATTETNRLITRRCHRVHLVGFAVAAGTALIGVVRRSVPRHTSLLA